MRGINISSDSSANHKILDLYCGSGGAATGYKQAGFEVVGVDVIPQPHYPFQFIQADALEFLASEDLSEYVAIHASPPCQGWSAGSTNWNGDKGKHIDLIKPTRRALKKHKKFTIIENVIGAPLSDDSLLLCGTMFEELRVIRHRLFETNFYVTQPFCEIPHPRVYTIDKRKKHFQQLDEMEAYVQVTGGGNCSKEAALDAMAVDWYVHKLELNQMIPPPYTRYIGKYLTYEIQKAAGLKPRRLEVGT